MKYTLPILALTLMLTSCTSLGKDMHTQRALDECREEVGNDTRDCERRVEEERYKRDVKDRIEKEKKSIN